MLQSVINRDIAIFFKVNLEKLDTTVRMLHKAFDAISLFSNPCFSKDSIKICRSVSSCGGMVMDDTKTLTVAS